MNYDHLLNKVFHYCLITTSTHNQVGDEKNSTPKPKFTQRNAVSTSNQ